MICSVIPGTLIATTEVEEAVLSSDPNDMGRPVQRYEGKWVWWDPCLSARLLGMSPPDGLYLGTMTKRGITMAIIEVAP